MIKFSFKIKGEEEEKENDFIFAQSFLQSTKVGPACMFFYLTINI